MITAAAVVAADKVLNEETVRPGLIGLAFFVGLVVATYFLWRSMNKQLKKVDANFADEDGVVPSRNVRIPLAEEAPRAGSPGADAPAATDDAKPDAD